MRNEHFPLPHIKTLQKYAQRINLRSGILRDVLHFLKVASLGMTEQEKAVVLLYDEMKVRHMYEYDKQYDEVVGPHNYVQVVMARSLFGNWKQPIYVGFDKNMSKALLFQIIQALHEVSFTVVAVVSDCGPSNQNTLNELGISIANTYFHHPATNSKIFCFLDAPHLLKLIRNWLLNTGFKLSDGQIVEKKLLVDLIRHTANSEVSSIFKLTEKHVNVEGTEKQNVALSSQLLSHSTATAINRYYNSKESQNLSYFIQLVNDWFDIMNSRNLKEPQVLKKPYQARKEQVDRLEEMFKVFRNMLCIGKISIQVFQKAILISVKSLKELYVEMERIYKINFILTSKLNQDALENLFGQIRSRGGLDDHPTPLNMLYRLRLVILGKNPGVVHERTNVLRTKDSEEYLLATVFKVAEVEPSIEIIENDFETDCDNNSSISTNSSSEKAAQVEEDGLNYLSGWLARKFSKKYPKMGEYTYMLKREEHSYQKPSWVNELSYGGLTEPSKELSKNVKILEAYFKKLNKKQFFSKKLFLKRMFLRLKNEVDLPDEITQAFIRQRLFIRMKKLNQRIKLNEIKKRGENKKSAAKMRRTVN